MGARWGWRRAIGGAAGLTRMAWHRRGQKTGPAMAASTSTAIFGEHRRRLKAPRTPGSPGGGEGQDQLTGRGSEAMLTEGGGSGGVSTKTGEVDGMRCRQRLVLQHRGHEANVRRGPIQRKSDGGHLGSNNVDSGGSKSLDLGGAPVAESGPEARGVERCRASL
jgi:hypothetical protein